MSYARFKEGVSDVYVFAHHAGYVTCCGCSLSDGEENFTTITPLIEHLHEHVAAGHVVPEDLLKRIKYDRTDFPDEDTLPGIKETIDYVREMKRIAPDGPARELVVHKQMLEGVVEHLEDYETLETEYSGLLQRQGDLLTQSVNLLRGDPPLLTTWSHHDIPPLIENLIAERDDLKRWLKDAQEERDER